MAHVGEVRKNFAWVNHAHQLLGPPFVACASAWVFASGFSGHARQFMLLVVFGRCYCAATRFGLLRAPPWVPASPYATPSTGLPGPRFYDLVDDSRCCGQHLGEQRIELSSGLPGRMLRPRVRFNKTKGRTGDRGGAIRV